MAAYGAQLKEGKTPAQAQAYLKALFHNVVSQDSSARNALQTFLAGRGDALIDYENEAISDQKKGARDRIRHPERHDPDPEPDRGASRRQHDGGDRSSSTTCSPRPARQIWVEKGYRPVISGVPGAEEFPTPKGLFTIDNARRLENGDEAVLRTGNGHRHEDRAVAGGLHCQVSPPTSGAAAPAGRRWLPLPAGASAARARGGPGARSAGVLGRGLLDAVPAACSCCCRSRRCSRSPATGGLGGFWREVSNPRGGRRAEADARRSRRSWSLVNAVFGTLIAWVLVRDEFRGKRSSNALIDLPFALPTIVAGLVLLALYGNGSPLGIDVAFTRASIVLALLFVTLPFVVRSVQPVLIELDREMEEAAASLGAGPADRTSGGSCCRPSCPAIVSGVALSFARAHRRVRLGRADHRQPPVQDRGRLGLHLRPDRGRKPAARPRPSSVVLLLSRCAVVLAARARSRSRVAPAATRVGAALRQRARAAACERIALRASRSPTWRCCCVARRR